MAIEREIIETKRARIVQGIADLENQAQITNANLNANKGALVAIDDILRTYDAAQAIAEGADPDGIADEVAQGNGLDTTEEQPEA